MPGWGLTNNLQLNGGGCSRESLFRGAISRIYGLYIILYHFCCAIEAPVPTLFLVYDVMQ